MTIGAALATDLCTSTAALNDPGADVLHSLRRHMLASARRTGTASELDWVRAGRVNCRGQDLVARSAKSLQPQKNTQYWLASMDRRLLTMP